MPLQFSIHGWGGIFFFSTARAFRSVCVISKILEIDSEGERGREERDRVVVMGKSDDKRDKWSESMLAGRVVMAEQVV